MSERTDKSGKVLKKVQGRFTTEEKDYMREHGTTLLPEAIADTLNRSTESVASWLVRNKIKTPQHYDTDPAVAKIKTQLLSESFWDKIKMQLTETEVNYFIAQYCEHILQLEKLAPVEHTEKMQVMDLIRNNILLDRILAGQKSGYDQYLTVMARIDQLDPVTEAADITVLRKIAQEFEHNFSNYTKETKALQDAIDKSRKDLKGTREQRAQDLKALAKDFEKLVKQLQGREFKDSEGAEINVFRAAMEVEKKRLQQWHEFVDGEMDIPLLTPEIIDKIRNENA